MKGIEQSNYLDLEQQELSNLKKDIEWNNDKDLEKFLNLIYKDTITDKEMSWVVKYKNNIQQPWPLSLCIKKMTDNQAKELLKLETKALEMRRLETITDNQAKNLWHFTMLNLDWLKTITDKQTSLLSNLKVLYLNWLTSITDMQANELSHVDILYINKNILTPKQKDILKNNII